MCGYRSRYSGGRLIRRVRRVEGEIEVERRGRVVPIDELDRIVAEQRGGIALLDHPHVVAVPVHDAVLLVGEVVDLADERTVLVVEPPLLRPVLLVRMAEMPLADDGGLVAGLLERLRQQPFVGGQAVGVRGRDDSRLQTVAQRIAAGQQGGPGWRAHRLNVVLLQLRPGGGEAVESGRLDVRPVEAHVLPAQVVGDDEEDVGLPVGGQGRLDRAVKPRGRHDQ